MLKKVPIPSDHYSEEEIRAWHRIGSKLIHEEVLSEENVKHLESWVFWETRKNKTLENLTGIFTQSQLEILEGARVKLLPSVLLSNYKAIQDEINELRLELGLKPESPQYISNTPVIPDEAYQNLPELLKNCCSHIESQRDKDMFLLYSLPVLAFHLTGVCIEHSDGVFSPSIKSFVLHPNGTVNKYARKSIGLATELNNQVLNGNTSLKYPLALSLADMKLLNKSLAANKGKVLIFEETGGLFSNIELLRSSIFSEVVENSFKERPVRLHAGNEENFIITPSACISICGELNDLKTAAELFGEQHLTNYLFYLHDDNSGWESIRPTAQTRKLTEDISTLSNVMYRLYVMCENRANTLQVELEDSHWQMIDETFQEKAAIIGDLGLKQPISGMIQNSSIYVLKFAAIFRLIRSAQEGTNIEKIDSIKTRDEDLTAALWLVDTLMKHAVRIYQNLPAMQENVKGDRYHRFYNLLPIIFDTSRALEIASRISLPKRTANRYLLAYLENSFLWKLRKGVYHKNR